MKLISPGHLEILQPPMTDYNPKYFDQICTNYSQLSKLIMILYETHLLGYHLDF